MYISTTQLKLKNRNSSQYRKKSVYSSYQKRKRISMLWLRDDLWGCQATFKYLRVQVLAGIRHKTVFTISSSFRNNNTD